MVIDVSTPGFTWKGVPGLTLVTERPLFTVIWFMFIGACPMFFTLIVATFVFADASTLSIKRMLPFGATFLAVAVIVYQTIIPTATATLISINAAIASDNARFLLLLYFIFPQVKYAKNVLGNSLSSDEKRKLYDVIDDLLVKFSESRNSIKDLDNLINELKPKIQSKEVDVKSLHIEETINNITTNMMKTLTIFRNLNSTQ
jgi:hypothetical protein